jgi:hypothetical protein
MAKKTELEQAVIDYLRLTDGALEPVASTADLVGARTRLVELVGPVESAEE